MDLRPYQLEAIDGCRQLLRAGKKKVLIVCPTGGGKTVIASEIIRAAVAKGSRVVFLAHRRELIQQTCDKLYRFGVRHGVIMAGERMALHERVQVASVQTLIRHPGQLTQVDLIFADEAHHVTESNTYAKVFGWYPKARLVGLTATPWRLDGKGLGDVFDGHVLARTPRQLRDEGFLVSVGGWEYEGIDTTRARVQRGDFVVSDLQRSAISTKVVGDIVGEWLEHARGRRTVLFAINIEHSQHMVQAFRKAGVAAEHVDGEMATADRDAVLARLRSGQTQVVCNCNVLTEGFDCPELEVCILARPTLSTALYLQMVGRVLRPAAGKTMARIHDHAGCLAAHGHPFADRDYSPESTARADRKSCSERVPRDRRCPECQSVLSRYPCDACNFSPTPQMAFEIAEAARRNRIDNDGVAKPRPKESDADRARKWAAEWAHDEERKYRWWLRKVDQHGVEKARRVYWWFSGNTEPVPMRWVHEARDRAREAGAA